MKPNKVVERYARKLAPLTTDVGIKKMKILTICLLLMASTLSYAEMGAGIQLKSTAFSNGDQTNNYAEVLKDGDNFLAAITQTGDQKAIEVWFDQNRTLSMSDTNGDSRSDRFIFSTDHIPQMVFDRGENDKLIPIAPEELKKMQDFAKTMSEEFPKVIDAAKTTNDTQFWGFISNILEKDEESQQGGPGYPPQGVGSPDP